MKNQKSIVLAVLILVVIAGLQLFSRKKSAPTAEVNNPAVSSTQTTNQNSSARAKATEALKSASTPAKPQGEALEAVVPTGGPSTAKERASLQTMAQTLARAIQPNAKQADLMRALNSLKMEPKITQDKNAYTGDMDIVRANNPLPGTRYFHAQYFGDAHTEKFVQHMSFEFKPGPNAVNEAVAAAQAAFKVGAPNEKRGAFSQWELSDGYCLWISPLNKNDIKDNPFNAYTEKDIGSVRMAVELCPHDHQ